MSRRTSWSRKFANACRGVARGVATESSFSVHIAATLGVVAICVFRHLSLVEWAVLVVSIGMVLAGELFNSALERLARAITSEENDHIRDALDIASGAVLLLSIVAVVVGALILIPW